MNSISLSINGLPIFGSVSHSFDDFEVRRSSQDCWTSYYEWFQSNVAEGPCSVLRENSVWMVHIKENGAARDIVFEPKGWFITLAIHYIS